MKKAIILAVFLSISANAQQKTVPEFVIVVNCVTADGKAESCKMSVAGSVKAPGQKRWHRIHPGQNTAMEHISPVQWHINADQLFKLTFTVIGDHRLSFTMTKTDRHGVSELKFKASGRSVYATNFSVKSSDVKQ